MILGRRRIGDDFVGDPAIGDFIGAGPDFKHFTGYEGIFCGFSAIYAGLAQVLNETFGKVILPLGSVMK